MIANAELKELLPKITEAIYHLYPEADEVFCDGTIDLIADIAYTIAKNDGFEDNRLILGTALLILDMFLDDSSGAGLASRTIDGVSETYATNKYSISKWRKLYERLLSGEYDTEYSLHYVGIRG